MPALSPSLSQSPRADQWLRFTPDGAFELRTGKVELGQGISAALTQIACDTLGIATTQVQWVAGDTTHSPDEGYTAGSQSIEVGGMAWRHVGHVVRSHFAQAAAQHLSCDVHALRLAAGVFIAPSGQGVSYHALAHADPQAWQALCVDDEATPLIDIPTDPVSARRDDLWLKFTGAGFIQDLQLPDLWHARVLRGPHPDSRPIALDTDALAAIPGVDRVLVQHQFVALIGRDEGALIKAHAQAKASTDWSVPDLPQEHDAEKLLPQLPKVTHMALQEASNANASAVEALHLQRRYSRPYLAHASIGPACALAQPDAEGLQVWSHSQGVFKLREQIAQALQRPIDQVRLQHAAGAGCYGHNGADDVAFDAAFIAHTWGLNVRVQWSREDEMTVAPMGAASVVDIQASVDQDGRISRWHTQVWSPSHLNRPGWGDGIQLLGAWSAYADCHAPTPKDVPLPTGGGLRNAVPAYDVGQLSVEQHFLDTSPVRVSALRSLGAHANVFAIESFMDELSEAAGIDPITFRLQHLSDPRARHVIETVARQANWQARGAAGSGHGYGLGYARYKNKAGYCALIAHVEVAERVKVHQIWACVDAGAIVHHDGLLNQIEGGILQAMSWSLHESVRWDAEGIVSRDWENYPVLSFQDVPQLDIQLIDSAEHPSLGSGEVATGPCAAALGNAVAHALGIRARHLPLNAERLMQAIDEDND
jgi:CO/xanthine dehydrogenase Mo-binding subunit